jgi:hypothetical protein
VLESQPRSLAVEHSLTVAYDFWVGSWDAALAAVATATQSRTLSTNEAAAHKAVIAAEREIVTEHFTLLLGHPLPEPGAAARKYRLTIPL